MDTNGLSEDALLHTPDDAAVSRLQQLIALYKRSAAEDQATQRELEQKVSEAAALQSYYDLQTAELEMTRNYTRELLNQAEAAAERERDLEKQLSLSVSTGFQLEEIKTRYNLLQVQLNDLAERLQQLNILLQQQLQYTGRVAELESLLAIAEAQVEFLQSKTENDPS